MSNWKLVVDNIGGFKGEYEFILKDGINLIVGDNATGKTTIINAIKLLNNLNLKHASKDNRNGDFTYQDFLNIKTRNAKIKLSNGDNKYYLYISSPAGKITSYLDGKTPLIKNDRKLISDDPNVIKFTFLDKTNSLMESIEYSGTVEQIKDEILKLSNIDNYESILNHVRVLKSEYLERKESQIKKLNDERKEIELKIQENLSKLEDLQKELNEIHINLENSDEINRLKEYLQDQNNKYNNLRLKDLDGLIQIKDKTTAKIEKDTKRLELLKRKKVELENFIELEKNIVRNENLIKEYDSKLDKFADQKNELNTRRHYILHQIQLLKETLKKSEDDLICQHCLNPINIRKINHNLEELEKDKKDLLSNIRDIESEIQILSKKRNKLNSLILNQKDIPRKLSALNSEINALQNKISVNGGKKTKLEISIEKKDNQLNEIQKAIENFQNKIIELSSQNDDSKQKYTELITKINLIKEENNNINSKKNLLIQKILILPENYDILIKRTEILSNILNGYIEKFYFDFIDNINKELEILLLKLDWNFQEVYIDDHLNLNIKNSEGKPQKFNSLSDFEKKSIAILILLIIKMEYYPDYPLFVIDEHLNSADSERFIKFIPHLYEKILKSNIKLFLVTSLPNDSELEYIKDWEKRQFEDLTIFYK